MIIGRATPNSTPGRQIAVRHRDAIVIEPYVGQMTPRPPEIRGPPHRPAYPARLRAAGAASTAAGRTERFFWSSRPRPGFDAFGEPITHARHATVGRVARMSITGRDDADAGSASP